MKKNVKKMKNKSQIAHQNGDGDDDCGFGDD